MKKRVLLIKNMQILVNKKKCAEIANILNLKKYMLLGSNYKKNDQKMKKFLVIVLKH